MPIRYIAFEVFDTGISKVFIIRVLINIIFIFDNRLINVYCFFAVLI